MYVRFAVRPCRYVNDPENNNEPSVARCDAGEAAFWTVFAVECDGERKGSEFALADFDQETDAKTCADAMRWLVKDTITKAKQVRLGDACPVCGVTMDGLVIPERTPCPDCQKSLSCHTCGWTPLGGN